MSSPFIASFALSIQIAGFRCCCEEWESIPLKWWVNKLRNESAQLLRRIEAAQCLQGCGCLRDRRLDFNPNCHAGFPVSGDSKLGGALGHRAGRDRIPNRTHYRLGLRAHSGRNQAPRTCPSPKRKQFEKAHLDLCRRDWSRGRHRTMDANIRPRAKGYCRSPTGNRSRSGFIIKGYTAWSGSTVSRKSENCRSPQCLSPGPLLFPAAQSRGLSQSSWSL